ncbi:MAG: thioredoxin family protein [Nanoarchaeota archaeon]
MNEEIFKAGYFEQVADVNAFLGSDFSVGKRMIILGASWCRPCHIYCLNIRRGEEVLKPVFAELEVQLPIHYIDSDSGSILFEERGIANIQSIPLTMLLNCGRNVGELYGAKSLAKEVIPELRSAFGRIPVLK